MVGTTSGASDLLSLSTPGTDGFTVNKYYDGTFTTDGSTTTDEAITICFDGGTAAYNLVDGIEIGPGEVWFGKLPNTTVANIHAISVDSNMAGTGSAGEGNVQCMVAAIIKEV